MRHTRCETSWLTCRWHTVALCLTLLLGLAGCGSMSLPAAAPTPTTASSLDSPEGAAQAIIADTAFRTYSTQYFGDWHAVLDTPVLVHAYQAHTGYDYYDNDHWVASVRNGDSDRRGGLYDFVYLRAEHRLRSGGFGVISGADDPHAHQAFPYTSIDTALAQLRAARGLGLQSGTQPQLIFFPPDPAILNVRMPSPHPWKSGGIDPLDPMWRITATDGNDYFIGPDLLIHTADELPIDSNQKG